MWKKYFPASDWLPNYTFKLFTYDTAAGITLAAYAIPVSLAPILAEFTYDGLNKSNSQYLLYNPTAEFRMIDMTTDVNLTRVQFNVYWRDNSGQLFPLYIPAGGTIIVKFMWRSLVAN